MTELTKETLTEGDIKVCLNHLDHAGECINLAKEYLSEYGRKSDIATLIYIYRRIQKANGSVDYVTHKVGRLLKPKS